LHFFDKKRNFFEGPSKKLLSYAEFWTLSRGKPTFQGALRDLKKNSRQKPEAFGKIRLEEKRSLPGATANVPKVALALPPFEPPPKRASLKNTQKPSQTLKNSKKMVLKPFKMDFKRCETV